LNYQRKPKTFLIAVEAQDEVKSEQVFRTSNGGGLEVGDYIAAFTKFIKENPEKIEAISILLKKPSDWSTDALRELRKKLKDTPYKFTEENLRKAYHHELADIISIIKHAAKEEPLMSAQERVEKAIEHIAKGKEFTGDQLKWLELIKEHLIVNLAIDKEDFEVIPIFTRQGGWKRADRAFKGQMTNFLKKVNREVAA
jgi:type I restriction enzyme R subunit